MNYINLSRAIIYPKVVEMLNSIGSYEAELYENYSGRGMYGKTVDAIVTDAPASMIGALIMLCASELADDFETYEIFDILDDRSVIPVRHDSMGLSTIYY